MHRYRGNLETFSAYWSDHNLLTFVKMSKTWETVDLFLGMDKVEPA